jgi:hypothetical protein
MRWLRYVHLDRSVQKGAPPGHATSSMNGEASYQHQLTMRPEESGRGRLRVCATFTP